LTASHSSARFSGRAFARMYQVRPLAKRPLATAGSSGSGAAGSVDTPAGSAPPA
jgi:hypothetical protein